MIIVTIPELQLEEKEDKSLHGPAIITLKNGKKIYWNPEKKLTREKLRQLVEGTHSIKAPERMLNEEHGEQPKEDN